MSGKTINQQYFQQAKAKQYHTTSRTAEQQHPNDIEKNEYNFIIHQSEEEYMLCNSLYRAREERKQSRGTLNGPLDFMLGRKSAEG